MLVDLPPGAATAGGPVVRVDGLDGWVVTDAAVALSVLRDPRTWSSDRFDGPHDPRRDAWVAELAAEDPEVAELLAVPLQTLVALDPPDHTRLRAVLRPAFSAAAVGRLAPAVQREVQALLPALVTGEEVDAVAAFARPLPLRVVATLLGLERRTWARFGALAAAASTENPHAEDRSGLRRRLRAELELMRFFAARLQDATAPGEDPRVLPRLRAAVAAGDLSLREATGLCREVLVAGAESVAHHLATTLLALARRPDGLAAVREDVAGVVETGLREDPPFKGFWRRATREVVLGGVPIPRDGLVLLWYRALNATSETHRHLSFGHGIHFCLGAPLARLEARSALAAVAGAATRIELVAEPPFVASLQSHGPVELRVVLSP